jgi:hypothetical protein
VSQQIYLAALDVRQREIESAQGPRPRRRKPPNEYTSSLFYELYVRDTEGIIASDDPVFRSRFRMPVHLFHDLLSEIKRAPSGCVLRPFTELTRSFSYFDRWLQPSDDPSADRVENKPLSQDAIPLELLLLAALRVIGTNVTLDQMCEATKISIETLRQYLYELCRWGRLCFYPRHVVMPSTEAELKAIEKVYALAGFPGSVGSFDVTHVPLLMYEYIRYNDLKSGKNDYPTVGFQVAVDHTGRALHVSGPFPGTWNDKSISKIDQWVCNLESDPLFTEFKWKRATIDGTWEQDKGAYCIVDGGYLHKRCMMARNTSASSDEAIRWGKTLTSLRKDVECFFGRLKKRFTMFLTGVRFRDADAVANAFYFACALHNWLHHADGLRDNWAAFSSNGKQIDADLPVGNSVSWDEDAENDTSDNEEEPAVDPVGPPNVVLTAAQILTQHAAQQMEQLKAKSLVQLRKRLIAHHAYCTEQRWIGWPKRMRYIE